MLKNIISQQQSASNPNNSAWVFASAGSGKTKILTDRVLRLLLDDVLPSKILCLTFTNAAAIEMQNRINAELAKWVLCDDDELKEKLFNLSGHQSNSKTIEKARTLLGKILDDENKIRIQTIHAFCQNLIRLFPLEAKVRPDFEVLEPIREQLLLKQAQQNLIKFALSEKGSFAADLIKNINSELHENSLDSLAASIISKKDKLQQLKENLFGIENVILEIFELLEVSPNDDEEKIVANFAAAVNRDEIDFLLSEFENCTTKTNRESIAPKIRAFLETPNSQNFSKYYEAFFKKDGEERKIAGKAGKNEEILEIAAKQRAKISATRDKINSLNIAYDSAALLRFCDLILENYQQIKQKNGHLDYGDLIFEANKLLQNPQHRDWIRYKMDNAFDHILVDESQDTNHAQWNIVKALSEDFFASENDKKRSMFIVGDEKQSIYSFQGAEPNISVEIFEYFAEKLGNNLQKIELNNSFRSTKSVLAAVDSVFSNTERKKLISKVSEFRNHQPIRDAVGKVELWSQVNVEKEKEELSYDWKIDFSDAEKFTNEKILAAKITQKIAEIILEKRILPSTGKPANYGDFMILLRKRSSNFPLILEKTLNQNRIPFASVNRLRFSESLVIQDLLAAAKFALLTSDDLNLACLLKSPLIRVSEEELLELCVKKNAEEISLFEAIKNSPKFADLAQYLSQLIELKNQNCLEFFSFLLLENSRQEFLKYFGAEAAELIDKFLILVADFNQKFSPNLQKFLEFAQEFDPEISLSGNQENCVKISTIHGAKGLQAPIVFVPDCAYYFNRMQSAKETIFWLDSDSGKMPLWCRKSDLRNELLDEHRTQNLQETEEEYLRLLYVAMTRPQDELYLAGFGPSQDEKSWYEILKSSLPQECFVELDVEGLQEQTSCRTDYVTQSARSLKTTTNSNVSLSWPISKRFGRNASSAAHPSTPSHFALQGKTIHKILEIFGKNYREEKSYLADLARKILARESELNETEKNGVSEIVNGFLASEHFANLFNETSQFEVEIASKSGVKRLDLICEKADEILIVDYKSDERGDGEMPQEYVSQLNSYREILREIHPQKKINCAILWVRSLELEEV